MNGVKGSATHGRRLDDVPIVRGDPARDLRDARLGNLAHGGVCGMGRTSG
jgi:hypothetical protein